MLLMSKKKPKQQVRSETFRLRCRASEKAMYESVAEGLDMSASDWARRALNAAAKSELKRQQDK